MRQKIRLIFFRFKIPL